jgi:hypothetical protein
MTTIDPDARFIGTGHTWLCYGQERTQKFTAWLESVGLLSQYKITVDSAVKNDHPKSHMLDCVALQDLLVSLDHRFGDRIPYNTPIVVLDLFGK